MPGRDGTGPLGTGPIGWGRGGCMGFIPRFGWGRGMRGAARGFGFWPTGYAPMNPDALEAQADRLEEQAARLRNLAKQNRKPE